ncbi:hypothetical protein AB0F81_14385 [Actinoplanes sp. NPDC024001]|uniref:hypothetical protein n=1 Tax=Actinoplanes sp. NPDC024001 TaxID=3154598 RepID=UPI0033C8D46B
MIPTLILFGLLAGHWWRSTLLAAALGWPLLLVATGVMAFGPGLLGASALAVVNAAAGVLVHQGVARVVRGTARFCRVRDDGAHG